MKNILNKKLEPCSFQPLTGYKRDGYCSPMIGDYGNHLVCAKVNKKFLDFTASKGNDLRSVVKNKDNWCLCQNRWLEAYKSKAAPIVIKKATSNYIRQDIKDIILKKKAQHSIRMKHAKKKQKKGGKKKKRRVLLPKLRKIDKSKKKHHYHIKDPQNKRILAIEEGIQHEKNKTRKSKRTAAAKKKARFNILRIYRRNKDKKGCRIITKDMMYIDKKYKLGKTKKICGGSKNKQKTKKTNQTKKKNLTKKRKTKKKQFLYNPDDPKKSFDVYIDKNPDDTISIKYTTVDDVKNTIKKLERLYKKGAYSHKRIWQVGMIMKVRLEAMLKHKKKLYSNAKKVRERFMLANKYFKFLGKRTKEKNDGLRKKMIFIF